jgi:hypothetical protein
VRDHRRSIMTYCVDSGLPFGGAIDLHLSKLADVNYRRWMSYECEVRWPMFSGWESALVREHTQCN